jgi:hypothetical protein
LTPLLASCIFPKKGVFMKNNLMEIISDFKEERKKLKKIRTSITLSEERIDKIFSATSKACPGFNLLSDSEKIEFIIFYAEKTMRNSSIFNFD